MRTFLDFEGNRLNEQDIKTWKIVKKHFINVNIKSKTQLKKTTGL